MARPHVRRSWIERRAKLIGLYRQFEERQARLQEAMAKVGVDAFLSGHDGWYFHQGIRRKPDQRD
jgi:hypothetical protein